MIGWAVRVLLIAAGTVTGWFVAKDAPGFGVIQMMVAILLLALVIAVIAFWPARWTHRLDRLHKSQ
jgi:type II secretory pathway component PulJ